MTYISIKFPIEESVENFLFDRDTSTRNKIKSTLFHLLVTNEGERFYKPNFGCNLRKYLFDLNTPQNIVEITNSLRECTSKNLPGVSITNLTTEVINNMLILTVSYTFVNGVTSLEDSLSLEIGQTT
jgi:phage baseplate assembly protein W